MFLRRKGRKYSIVESYRDDQGRPRQSTVAYLGVMPREEAEEAVREVRRRGTDHISEILGALHLRPGTTTPSDVTGDDGDHGDDDDERGTTPIGDDDDHVDGDDDRGDEALHQPPVRDDRGGTTAIADDHVANGKGPVWLIKRILEIEEQVKNYRPRRASYDQEVAKAYGESGLTVSEICELLGGDRDDRDDEDRDDEDWLAEAINELKRANRLFCCADVEDLHDVCFEVADRWKGDYLIKNMKDPTVPNIIEAADEVYLSATDLIEAFMVLKDAIAELQRGTTPTVDADIDDGGTTKEGDYIVARMEYVPGQPVKAKIPATKEGFTAEVMAVHAQYCFGNFCGFHMGSRVGSTRWVISQFRDTLKRIREAADVVVKHGNAERFFAVVIREMDEALKAGRTTFEADISGITEHKGYFKESEICRSYLGALQHIDRLFDLKAQEGAMEKPLSFQDTEEGEQLREAGRKAMEVRKTREKEAATKALEESGGQRGTTKDAEEDHV